MREPWFSAPEAVRKVTVLEGYYASGDHECFCFDKLDGPGAYDRYEAYTDERHAAQRANRVYPDDLIPEDPGFGDWRITVEFVPRSEDSQDSTDERGRSDYEAFGG